MSVKRLTEDEYDDRLYYLQHVAGPDLTAAVETAGDNPAKVIELLRHTARYARECAPASGEVGLGRRGGEPAMTDRVEAPCDTVRLLALPYADHEDFDLAWRI